jgi:hypothetical protein
MVVHLPQSSVLIATCALLILVIPQPATAILHILHVMIMTRAHLTAVMPILDARSPLLFVMTTTFARMTRVMMNRVAFIQIFPASARLMTSARSRRAFRLMDAPAN